MRFSGKDRSQSKIDLNPIKMPRKPYFSGRKLFESSKRFQYSKFDTKISLHERMFNASLSSLKSYCDNLCAQHELYIKYSWYCQELQAWTKNFSTSTIGECHQSVINAFSLKQKGSHEKLMKRDSSDEIHLNIGVGQ